jgi:hypothetical protein
MAITTIWDMMATGPMQLHQRIPHLIRCGISENFKMHKGKMVCKHCGEPVAHPRAAAAHLAVHHKGKLEMNSDGLTGEHALRMPVTAGGPGSGRHPEWGARKDVATYNSADKAKASLDKTAQFFHPTKGGYNSDPGTKYKSTSVSRPEDNHVHVKFADGTEQHHVSSFTPSVLGTDKGKYRVSTYETKSVNKGK